MALRGTDPESYITEYTFVYGDMCDTKAFLLVKLSCVLLLESGHTIIAQLGQISSSRAYV